MNMDPRIEEINRGKDKDNGSHSRIIWNTEINVK